MGIIVVNNIYALTRNGILHLGGHPPRPNVHPPPPTSQRNNIFLKDLNVLNVNMNVNIGNFGMLYLFLPY